ncbi:MAG: SRPBCC family protein [Alphaproteobacteria bacterium]|nr:SRPBCC family protein [Alphaproteobacteria bacterium]MCB9793397.1 SRPBCC family protein [Alphaproteobacteria bacterium]
MLTLLDRALSGRLTTEGARTADASRPHPHRGRLAPYPTPPAPLPLDEDERARLDRGEPVFKQVELQSGGRGAAVFIVDAPTQRVWEVIRAFHRYPEWIDACDECEVYAEELDRVFTRFVISKAGISVEYFVEHYAPEGADWMTWTLDYDRRSDLDDSVGMWRVTPVPGQPGRSLVEYSVDLQIDGWVPEFVRSIVVDQGLKGATSWVQVQAEGQ